MVENRSHPKAGPNTDDYAQAMSGFLPSVEHFLLRQWPPSRNSLVTAFKLLLYIGKHACADMDAGLKMSGYGDSEAEYEKMDIMMEEVIDLLCSDGKEQELDSKPTAVDDENTLIASDGRNNVHQSLDTIRDVENHTRGRPRKKQRPSSVKQVAIREGRNKERDMLASGLKQLKKDRDGIKDFGLEGYFPESIKRLEELLIDE